MAKLLKFNRDAKGSNDGVTVLKFEAGQSYPIGPGADQVGEELVKAFTEDQKFRDAEGKDAPVATVVEAKTEAAAKVKTTTNEDPPKSKKE